MRPSTSPGSKNSRDSVPAALSNSAISKMSMHNRLREREYGKRMKMNPGGITGALRQRVKQCYQSMVSDLETLEGALVLNHRNEPNWRAIHAAIRDLLSSLLDHSNPDQVFHVSQLQKQQRQTFVSLGGVHMILRLFRQPYLNPNAALMNPRFFAEKSDLWNEVLILLRETCFAIPLLAESVFSNDHLVTLFTLLNHNSVFENTMNLLEEILASRVETFSLGDVPNLFALVSKFSCRHLAHFCRVLALVLFEPEDRHIMESSPVLRATELLQLRRDRMARAGNIVERNQSLIIDMPELLSRLVSLLRIMNYGPRLHDLLTHNIVAQGSVTADMLGLFNADLDGGDWPFFESLEQLVAADPTMANGQQDDELMATMLNAFSPNLSSVGAHQAAITTIWQIFTLAESLGLASHTAQGPMLASHPARRSRTAREARRELHFYAMILQPHQVELLFVLSTLLCGRRKVAVQHQLADLGLPDALFKMFPRLSWESPPYSGPNPLEHIHGPGCECNPESALRVQYLRLVHNFFERDFENNPVKLLMLSKVEQHMIERDFDERQVRLIREADKGLLSRIIAVFLREPADSVYRFWLSSVIEAFLRGNGVQEQLFVARSGVLEHILYRLIVPGGIDPANGLQSIFDLLGELVKGNVRVVEMAEACLSAEQVQVFMDRVMQNLVDSNVFLRCVYLTLERHRLQTPIHEPLYAEREFTASGYLTHSWLEFSPVEVVIENQPAMNNHTSTQTEQTGQETPTVSRSAFSLGSLAHAIRGLRLAASELLGNMTFNGSALRLHDDRDEEDETDTTDGQDDDEHSSEHETKDADVSIAAIGAQMTPTTASADTDDKDSLALPESVSALVTQTDIGSAGQAFRISEILAQHRSKILYRLMSSVTLHSVNHENICCLNSALILFVNAWKREKLPQLLAALHHHADVASQGGDASFAVFEKPTSSRGHNGKSKSPAEVKDVFINFRELLWFWQEYYLRRGRDRLSLEFSSHISFHVWKQVVDLLTADDGSSTALLGAPIVLPTSPYVFPPRAAPGASTARSSL